MLSWEPAPPQRTGAAWSETGRKVWTEAEAEAVPVHGSCQLNRGQIAGDQIMVPWLEIRRRGNYPRGIAQAARGSTSVPADVAWVLGC
jgi:hypothetical protein